MISRWVTEGYLHRVHPTVYAVGHRAASAEGELCAALLYGGPGAMLSHATAVWWFGLSAERSRVVEVSTPRRRRSLPTVRVYGRRQCERVWRNGLPVTAVAQTVIDYAGVASASRLRRVLSEADYWGLLDVAALEGALRQGHPGSGNLRRTLRVHQPRLAHTRSELELRFVALCEHARLPLPAINASVEGLLVDALWRAEWLIVELDGHRAHRSHARMELDRSRELRLRAAGFAVIRYTWRQLLEEADAVVSDLRANLRARAAG